MQSSSLVISPTSSPIKIGIVDDHPLVLSGLAELFTHYPDLLVVGAAGNAREALELVRKHTLDVLVLDIAMPGESGVDVLGRIVARAPDAKVLVFSSYSEQQYAMPMIRLGARAYVDKASPVLDIVDAVRTVASGCVYLSPGVLAHLAEASKQDPGADEIAKLTAREFQIFLRLAAGQSVTAIAAALSLSDVTISAHRSRLLKKLNLSSNSHLTRYALENDLLLHAGMRLS